MNAPPASKPAPSSPIPAADRADGDPVRSALHAAQLLWNDGLTEDAAQAVQRAAELAFSNDQDSRGLFLARAAVEIRAHDASHRRMKAADSSPAPPERQGSRPGGGPPPLPSAGSKRAGPPPLPQTAGPSKGAPAQSQAAGPSKDAPAQSQAAASPKGAPAPSQAAAPPKAMPQPPPLAPSSQGQPAMAPGLRAPAPSSAASPNATPASLTAAVARTPQRTPGHVAAPGTAAAPAATPARAPEAVAAPATHARSSGAAHRGRGRTHGSHAPSDRAPRSVPAPVFASSSEPAAQARRTDPSALDLPLRADSSAGAGVPSARTRTGGSAASSIPVTHSVPVPDLDFEAAPADVVALRVWIGAQGELRLEPSTSGASSLPDAPVEALVIALSPAISRDDLIARLRATRSRDQSTPPRSTR